LNYKESILKELQTITKASSQSLQRVKSKSGYAHYITVKNEQTFAHDLINENLVYFRKIFIDT